MSKPAKRPALEGQPREFVALLDGKQQPARHASAAAAFIAVREESWQMCSILQLVYSAGGWHHEGIVGRFMKDSAGKIVPTLKMSDTNTHTNRSHGGQQK